MYSISMTINALDGEDLRRQLRSILGDVGPGNPPTVEDIDAPAPAEVVEVVETPKTTRRRTTKGDATASRGEPSEGSETPTASTATEAAGSTQTKTSAPADAPEAGESGAGAKTADESEASAQPATSSSTSAADTASSDGSSVTINTIRELTLSVVDKRGKDGIEAVLSQFGVARSTQVPEEQWGELAQALRDALED